MTGQGFPSPIPKADQPVGAVMVVGSGIAGMQASLDLAEAGFKVYLVEKEPAIGGKMAALDKTFPTNDCAMCIISPRLVGTANHNNIEVLTNAELVDLQGVPGHFNATVRRKARYIDEQKCTACGDCAAVCPVTLPDEFNRHLNQRKAIFKLYPQAVPSAYAIEKEGVAPCKDSCPAGQRAQGYIALIAEGRFDEALRTIKEDNPFPGICGRICNHRCEDACNRSLVDEPVAIAALKRFVADQVYEKPYVPPEKPVIRFEDSVAIIGAGPCGLAAAKNLVTLGYGVTVFEALPEAGGMLRVGVPEFRLPTAIIDREVQEIIDLGVDLRLSTRIDDLEKLFDQGYSAILIAVGAHDGKRLPIENADHPDVLTAVRFLRDQRLGNGADLNGRNVLVLGGGNVAFDCARTLVRIGAKSVALACLESWETMPADREEIEEATEEGISIQPEKSFTRILVDDNQIVGVETLDVSLMRFEADGSLTLETVPESKSVLDCDTVIFAVGQRAELAFIPADGQVGVTRKGTVEVDPYTFSTGREGVFAAGDATKGTAYVIEAIADGHRVAENIHKYLQGESLGTHDAEEQHVVEMSPSTAQARVLERGSEGVARVRMSLLKLAKRSSNFEEVNLGYTLDEAQREASRCLQCGRCSECLTCEAACLPEAINHDDVDRLESIEIGALILASGFESYDAALSTEYGFGRYPNVVSALQYERILSPSGPYAGHLKRPSDSVEPNRIAWIQCVGSREADRTWCSAVCCMYATKQAIITMEHAPGTECTIFYIDFRAYGKGFDAYYERAKEEGVRYLRVMPSTIRQAMGTKNLQIDYSLPDGSLITEEFDMVVLSTGMQPPQGMANLATQLQVELTSDGFCKTADMSPVNTNREGVFVCGPLADPKDIPETVMSASAASARAMTLLADARHSMVKPREYPPEIDVSDQDPRVGVFICHCGTNIAGVVDVEAVAEYVGTLPDVVFTDHNLFTCSTDTQARIREAIHEHDLNRIVVASCTPRTHEPLFQITIREAGLNFYLFELANIRDQCSWVHRDFPDQATEKAKDLVRMAVAKVRLVEALERKSLEFNHDALVIGGGIAGMTTALELADQGFTVSLIERQKELGGNMRHLRTLLSHADPQALLADYIKRTTSHPNIRLFQGAEIETFEGSLGRFKSTLKATNGGEPVVINHGVTIVATGAQAYRPHEYLYGEHPSVLTQLELEELLADKPKQLSGKEAIVMIQCVGSRNEERPYCSRLCCSQAVKNALEVKRINPDTEVFVLYRDIRTYGLLEKFYSQAREAGVIFVRFEDDRPPQLIAGEPLLIKMHDALLDKEIELQADLVVLSVATEERSDAHDLAQLLKVPLTQEGFFQEAHLKLAPVDFASGGIYLCGMAHYPKAVTESVIQAIAAAGRASTVLSKHAIEIEPTISHVIDEKCDGCAYCVDPCPFKAITLIEYDDEEGNIKKRVVVDEALCKGCGTCMATCPKDAVFVWHFRPEQLKAMTMAALER